MPVSQELNQGLPTGDGTQEKAWLPSWPGFGESTHRGSLCAHAQSVLTPLPAPVSRFHRFDKDEYEQRDTQELGHLQTSLGSIDALNLNVSFRKAGIAVHFVHSSVPQGLEQCP